MRPIYLNGRFLSQAVTGVQRFAREITDALDRLWEAPDRPTLLLPSGDVGQAPVYRNILVRGAGRLRGHLWEQLELPIHARQGMLVNLANSAPILARRQIVVLHDASIFAHPEAYSGRYRRFHKALDRMLACSQARLATVSEFSRDELVRYLHVQPSRIGLLSEGFDHILRIPPDRTVLEQHGLAPRTYVLAVGSLVAHKNLASLGDLARMLAGRGLHLVVAGGVATRVFDGANLALPQPAKYLGRVSDGALRALYENAICLVFPSRYEGFGIPPVEAMGCGCPVVAATAGAIMELCGEAALYGDPDDPRQFSSAVARVIDEPGLADGMRERGRMRVKPLTWDNGAAALLRLLERPPRDPRGGAG
jgi:glycosyltransferase involved in cell wall biosynthesis